MFGCTENATIKNVNIVSNGNGLVKGLSNVGGIVGYAKGVNSVGWINSFVCHRIRNIFCF